MPLPRPIHTGDMPYIHIYRHMSSNIHTFNYWETYRYVYTYTYICLFIITHTHAHIHRHTGHILSSEAKSYLYVFYRLARYHVQMGIFSTKYKNTHRFPDKSGLFYWSVHGKLFSSLLI
jgi:hypothetical protein